MGFWRHVDALRGVLIRVGIVYVVAMTVCWAVMPLLFDSVVLWPAQPDFPLYRWIGWIAGGTFGPEISDGPFHVDLVSIELTSQFFVHMSASCWMALLLTFPLILYQLWTFIRPGLYAREQRSVRRALVWGNVMFYLGAAVAYFIVFPLALRFLADYHLSGAIRTQVSIDSYMDNFFTLLIVMGAVFELPLLAWLLGRLGVIHRDFFARYRRHAIMVLLIVSGIITPTGDPFTLLVVFIPLYALWEGSARLVPRKVAKEEEQSS